MSSYKTIGIIGGMGPLATADLFNKIINNTEAEKDQDHIRIIIDNNTNIPDRTKALLEGGSDPVPEMVKSAQMLESYGAGVLIMPCNTAHNFYDSVADQVNIPLLNMIDITCSSIKEKGIKKVGLMATTGTIKTGIYQRYCDKYGIELVQPDEEFQQELMNLIYNGVKAGKTEYDCTKIETGVDGMLKEGAQTIILGCTELPLAYTMYNMNFPALDPTRELARAAIEYAAGEDKLKPDCL